MSKTYIIFAGKPEERAQLLNFAVDVIKLILQKLGISCRENCYGLGQGPTSDLYQHDNEPRVMWEISFTLIGTNIWKRTLKSTL